ncbi:substrate-binding periplasmic protein [Simiduia agarivorans]|uniref:Uncharacterized protein n=1 Tax=Simiduia agarivorans (strain DSM 21679 / JCM 13881 / BCRC 17597 / SA1) TaxID=1117647 RepID=K4KEV6_SIMAS|nr:transporter substrate-binding domain-containing protein [Simiduia agarivorans]AFU97594.1 hypothetical protein M5M_01875 [Simiduia agarivorans SA1 = DSM 21679]
MRQLLKTLLLLPCLAMATTAASDSPPQVTLEVNIPRGEISNSGHLSYVIALLQLALEKSKQPHERIELVPIEEDLTQARLIAELIRSPDLDVIWTMTSREREALIRPIRIPILKGLLGQRVFLIRADRQAEFSRIKTIAQLAQLRAGQGSHWPDTEILRANGLNVHTSPHYELLFTMLKGGRFDYFPRGINEAWPELAAHPDEGLAIESELLLQYPAPMYFFVKHEDSALAQRIEKGLNMIIDSGEMDTLFLNHPSIKPVLESAALTNRRVFMLNNPTLPEQTPLHDRRLWITCCAP